jgi:hypothetical protein
MFVCLYKLKHYSREEIMKLTKTAVRELNKKNLMPDGFVDSGETSDFSTLNFRRTEEDEIFPCCARVGNDSQSGPLYCNELSEWIAIVPAEDKNKILVFALCGEGRHKPAEGKIIEIK